MKMNFSVPVIALLAGTALGFVLKPDSSAVQEPSDSASKKHAHPAAIAEEARADERALRLRIKELERLLAERKGESPSVVTQVVGDAPGPRMNFRERFEKMKKEEPEKYAEIKNRMERFREMERNRTQARTDFLSSIDISGLSAKDRENHEKFKSLLARKQAIMDEMHNLENMSDEDHHSLMRKIIETDMQLRESATQERNVLIMETARAIGLSDSDAQAVAGTIQEVIDVTSSGFGPPPHGPRPQKGR